MAEQGLSNITVDTLREHMSSRFRFLHYNDQYHGRHAGQYDLLREMLADDVIDDDGSSDCVRDDVEQLLQDSAPVAIVQDVLLDSFGERGDNE